MITRGKHERLEWRDHDLRGPLRLTQRGYVVLACLGVFVLIFLMGLVGLIEKI